MQNLIFKQFEEKAICVLTQLLCELKSRRLRQPSYYSRGV